MDGWEFFEPPPAQEQPQAQDIDILMARTFATEEGRQVLAWLRRVTIETPAWAPGQEASFGYAREGQNSIVREIERRIERAKQ
jgi:hypothetical protein